VLHSSLYTCYPILVYYKGLFLTEDKILKLLNTFDIDSFVTTINDIYKDYFRLKINSDNILNIEMQIEKNFFYVFHKFFHFFYGKIIEFAEVFFDYFKMRETIFLLRETFLEKHILDEKLKTTNIYTKEISEFYKKNKSRPLVFYEFYLLQFYFKKVFHIFDVLKCDKKSFEIIKLWIDFLNLKIILTLALSYNYSVDEIRPLLIPFGSDVVYNNMDKIINLNVSNGLEKHPLLKGISFKEYYEIYGKILGNLKIFVSKSLGGIPFRYSFYVAFFLILVIDSERLKIILNGKSNNLDIEILKRMVGI